MKKQLFFFLLMCLVALAAHSAPIYYLNESFDSGSLPAGWSQEVMSDETCLWIIDTVSTYPNGVYSGSGRAALRNSDFTTHGYVTRLITPAMNLPGGGPQYEVSFAYAQAKRNNTWDQLKVYYSFDGATWTILEEFTDAQNQWQLYKSDLVGAAGQSAFQLAFEANDFDGWGVVLDDVKVMKKSECADVTNFGAIAASSSVTIYYQKDFGSTAQLVVDTVSHDMASFAPAADNVFYYGETTNDQVDIAGLDSQRKYYAYIRTICDDNESGFTSWVSMSFTTSVGFPFFEGFSGGALPSNWQNLYGSVEDAFSGILPVVNTSSSYKWSYSALTIIMSSTHAVGGPHSQYSGGYVYTPTWFVSPAIDLTNVSEPAIELSFKLAMSSSTTTASEVSSKSNYKFMVLISMDGGESWSAADATTYEGTTLSATAQRKRIALTGYEGNVIQIAFVAVGSGTLAYFHLDDVKIDTYDINCGDVKSVSISDLSDMSAMLNWTLAGKDSVIVELAKYSSFSTKLFSDTIAPADHKRLLDGLDSKTTYYARVRQVCPDAEWVSTSFTTAQGLDYLNAFTSSTWPSEWKRYTGVKAEDVFNGASLGTPGSDGWKVVSNSSVPALGSYVAKFNLFSSSKYYWMVSPAIYLNPASATNVELSLVRAITAYTSSGISTTNPSFSDTDDQYIILVSDDAGATWKRENAIIWDCVDTTAGYLAHHDLRTLTAEPEVVKMDLSHMIGKTIQVAIYAGSTTSGSDNDVCAGNITVKRFDPNCAGLENIVISADIHDAKAKWGYRGTQAAIAQLATNSTFSEGLISDTIAPADSIKYEGLEANSKYYFRVKQDCELGEWSQVMSFTTHCEADTIPYINGFEDDAANAIPSCWTLIQDANGYPKVMANSGSYSVYSHTGSKYLSWGSGSTGSATISYASLPAFESAVNEVEMSFWTRAASSYGVDTVEVGVMSNPLDPASFVKVGQVVPNSSSYQQYFISFANYAGQGQYIAFKRLIGKKYAMYIDDIDVHALPACHRLGEVSASSMTANGATIKFDQTNAENFQIVFTSEAIDPDTLGNVADSLIAYNQVLPYAPAMVISDAAILPNTLYYAYVRGVCSDDEKGAWSLPISFTTLCAAVDPASYGVETFDVAKNMSCWATGFLTPGTSSSSATAGRKTDTKYGAYLQLSKEAVNSTSSTYSDGAYAISPELAIDDITNYQITFSAATTKSEAINVSRLEIGVVTNPSDMETYEKIKIIPLTFAADSAAEKVYVIDFKDYPGDIYGQFGKYIMFKSVAAADSTNYVLIDNVSFQEAASCPQVIEMSVDSIGLTSALLKFENNGAAQYEVLVSTINTRAVDTLASADFRQIVATNRAEISGLNSSTQYYAYVRAICGEGDSAAWSASAPFMTKFGVPYTEQFESSALSGWSIYSSANFSSVESMSSSSFAEPTSYTWSLVNSTSSSYLSGMEGKVVRSYIYYYYNYNSWLISPAIDMTANEGQNIKLTFKAARTSYTSYSGESSASNVSGYKLYVVISTDDGATWNKVDATSWLTDGSGDFSYNDITSSAKEYTISLSKYAGQSIRLGFYTESSSISTNNYLFVDDIHVFTYEAVCQGVKKLAVEVDGLSAKATWEIEGTPAKTIVELSDASDFANLIATDTLDGVFEKEYSDLALSSTYYVRAKQADCEDAEWQIKSFKTPLGLPYGESFNASVMPSDWTIMSGSPASAFAGTNPTISSGGWIISTSNNGLPANHTKINIYNATNNRWLVSPAISLANVAAGTEVLFSFDFAYTNYNSAGAIDKGSDQALLLAVSEDGGASWSQANSWEWSHTDSTAAVVYPLDSISLTGTHLEFDFSQFIGKTIQIAFVAINKSQDNDFHLANIVLKPIIANCDDPTDLAVDSVSTNMAALSWVGDEAKVSVVEYATSADFSANLKRDTVAAGLVDTLLNLNAATKYYVRVHQLCGGDNKTGYANMVNFLTDCDLFTITKENPYLMDFENEATGTGSAPVCWTVKRSNSNYPYIYSYSYYAHSGNNMLYFGGSSGVNKTQYAILPEVTNNANELQVNFFLAGYSSTKANNDSIIIGVMTDPNDLSTFVPVQGFQAASSSYVEQEVWLNTYEGDGHYVAIKRVPVEYYSYGYSYYGSYVDDIKLSLLPTCHRIDGLKASALAHSAVVSHNASNAGQYELIVTNKAISPDTVATVADSVIMYHATEADTAINVSGLEAQTKYYVYLRGVCDDEDKSDWTTANFLTMCDPITVEVSAPYEMNFEDEASGSLPSCWVNLSGSSYPYVSSKYLYYGGYSGNYDTIYTLLPEVSNDINKLQMTFQLRGASSNYTYNDSIVIGVMSSPTDTLSFVPVKGFRAQSSTVWEDCEVFFNNYVGDGHFIAIKRVPIYYYGSSIDSVVVSIIPTCTKLATLEVANISRREFDVNWSAKTPAEGQHYDLVISKTQLDDAALELAAKQDLDTAFYHASGLDREATYYIYVRANCGGEDGVGEWMSTSVKTKGLSACDQMTDIMGGSSSAPIQYVPWSDFYNSTYSQMIYTADELHAAGISEGEIAKIAFKYACSSAYTKSTSIYMGTTGESAFSSAAFISDLEEVLPAQSIEYKGAGTWIEIELAAPYYWDGVNNLVVAGDFIGTNYPSSGTKTFYGGSCEEQRTIYARSDSSDPMLSTSPSRTNNRPDIRLFTCYAIDACPAVDSVGHELTGEGTNTARIAWKAGAGDYANTYDLIVSDTIVTDFASAAHVADSIDALYYDVEDLEAYTDYYVYVRVNCDAENMHDGTSGWSEAHMFKTNSACRVISNLNIKPTGKTSALATWNGTTQDNNFQYILSEVALSKEEQEIAIPTADALTDTFAILSGLTSGQKYYIYVANSCGAGGVSPYVADSVQLPDGCPAVADLRTNYVAFNAVGIEWNRGAFGEEEQWLVGIEEDHSRDLLVADSSYLFIGLEQDSTYHFFAQAVCGEGDSSLVRVIEVHTPTRPSGGAVIAEGSAENEYTPVHGLYCDETQRSQSIYPADMLSDLKGQTILGLNYVVTTGGSTGTNGSWENVTFNVRIGVTTKSDLSSGWATDALQTVYTGTLHASVADGMHIVLDEPFIYEGGNLLIEFELPVKSGYASCKFQGIAQTGASRTVHGTSASSIRDFLPQVEFVCAAAGCAPTKLAASNITTTSADINWFPGDVEMSWAVLLSDSVVSQAALDTLTGDTVEVLKLHYDDLTPDVDYHFYIRSFCSATETSAWKELIFRTMPSCFAPTALDADSLASDAARVVWKEMNEGFSGNYTVAYGKKDSFNLAVDTTYQIISEVADTVVLLSGLESNTEYSFAVRSNCGEGDLSRWSEIANFRTECGAITSFPWSENFDSYTTSANFTPDCWVNEHIAGSGTSIFKTSTSTNGTNTTTQLQLPDMNAGTKTILVLPEMNLPENYEFKLDVYRNGTPSTYGDVTKEGVRIYISQSDTIDASAQELGFISRHPATADAAHGIPAEAASGWYTYTFNLPVSGNNHIIVVGESQYCSSTYMDNFLVRAQPTCAKPSALAATAGIDTALVVWEGNAASYIVELSEGDKFDKIDILLASDTAIVLRDLKSGTAYSVRVTSVCDDSQSDVSSAISFVTSCGLPFAENFDASTILPASWIRYEGDILSSEAESVSYGWNVSSSTGGGMTANHVYSGVSIDYESYYSYNLLFDRYTLATPAIMLNAQDNYNIELSFDMALTNSSTGSVAPDAADCAGREFSVVISTDGGQSWSALATWSDTGARGTYASIPATSNHVTVDLSAYANQSVMIGFYNNVGDATYSEDYDPYWDEYIIECATTYIHLDNVKILEKNANCMGVADLAVSNVSFVGAQVDWGYNAGSHDAVIALSKSNVLNLDNAIVVDTVWNDSTYLLPALDASSTYYVFVEQLCEEGETSAWEMTSFATAIGVPYDPVFAGSIPSDWTRYSGLMDSVVLKSDLTTTTSGWSYAAADTIINTGHVSGDIWNTTFQYWLISPSIDLTPNVGDGLMLNFDLGRRPYTRATMNDGVDDKFMVIISEDGGETWTLANATVWNNDGTGQYVYNDIQEHGQTFHINLSEYAGKTIQIAFYGESTVSNADNYVHFGNISIDRVEAINYIGDVCDGEDYDGIAEGNPFFVSSDEYQPGLNIYSQYHPADPSVDGSKDTMLVLNLMVNMPASYEYAVEVCEGEHYVDANFDINITLKTPTVQRKRGLQTVAGCDSTIVMNLTIHPIQHVDIFGLTCQGTPYHFGGKDIYQAGTYYDTASSVITGCDSITTLYLSYDQPSEDWRDKILCNGDSYTMADGTVISEAGQYVEHATKASSCDSLIHWNILVADEFGVARDTVDVTELPYFFNNQQVLAADAEIGSHDVTVPMSCGDGILRILVEQKTGLLDIRNNRRDVQKLIMDERLIIIRNGKTYDALGGHVRSALR